MTAPANIVSSSPYVIDEWPGILPCGHPSSCLEEHEPYLGTIRQFYCGKCLEEQRQVHGNATGAPNGSR